MEVDKLNYEPTFWTPATERLPPLGEYVIAIAPSGYSGTPWRFFEAQCDPSYKGWVTSDNTKITEYCPEGVIFWMPMIATPKGATDA